MKVLGTLLFIVLFIIYFADLMEDVTLYVKETRGIVNITLGIIAIILLCTAYALYLYL